MEDRRRRITGQFAKQKKINFYLGGDFCLFFPFGTERSFTKTSQLVGLKVMFKVTLSVWMHANISPVEYRGEKKKESG